MTKQTELAQVLGKDPPVHLYCTAWDPPGGCQLTPTRAGVNILMKFKPITHWATRDRTIAVMLLHCMETALRSKIMRELDKYPMIYVLSNAWIYGEDRACVCFV